MDAAEKTSTIGKTHSNGFSVGSVEAIDGMPGLMESHVEQTLGGERLCADARLDMSHRCEEGPKNISRKRAANKRANSKSGRGLKGSQTAREAHTIDPKKRADRHMMS
jgi:hypothetical protein